MTFTGFTPPTKNYFPMPNNWIDICAEINNLAELKVIQYVLRHTWGYREYGIKKAITTDEFMHGRKRTDGSRMDKGTGLSNRSVIDGLRAAVEHGYLECELDDTDKARKVKSYAIKMRAAVDVKNLHIEDEPDVKNLHSSYEESSHLAVDSSHRSEKDTRERHFRKKESTPTVPSSTPSLSLEDQLAHHQAETERITQELASKSLEHLSTISTELSTGDVDKPVEQSHIAKPTIEEPVATGSTSTTPNALSVSPEQKRIAGYLKKLKFLFPSSKENHDYLAVVAEHIESFEQMKSYYDFTRGRFNGGIFLGNLANLNNMNLWLQTQELPPEKPKSTSRNKRVLTLSLIHI